MGGSLDAMAQCIYYGHDARTALTGISLTLGSISMFFALQGQHVAPIRVKFGVAGSLIYAEFCSISNGWVWDPKTENFVRFLNINF